MELVYLFTLGRCLLKRYRIVWAKRLDDIKGGTWRLWKEGMGMEASWVTYPSPHIFFYMDCDLCSAPSPS